MATATGQRTTTTSASTTTTNPTSHGLATPAQLAALAKFRCDVPAGLDKQAASDWLDLLVGKLKAGEGISDLDVSGPPSFRPASTLPPSPVPVPVPVDATGDIEPLPTSEEWVTVSTEIETDPGAGVKRRRYVKIAAHPAPGETYEDAARRLMKKAEMALAGDEQ